MVIVQGSFEVRPEERLHFIDARLAVIEESRQEDGCLEYVLAADPIDPARVVISERWESMEHLQRHLDKSRPALPPPLGVEITVYEISSSNRLR